MDEYEKSTSFQALFFFFTFVSFFHSTKHWGSSFYMPLWKQDLDYEPKRASSLMQSSAMSSSREQSYKRSDTRGSPLHLSFSHFWGRSGGWVPGSKNGVCSTRCWEKMPSKKKKKNLTGILPDAGMRALLSSRLD